METQDLQVQDSQDFEAMQRLLLRGDISKMTFEQKLNYYNLLCKSLGLNPLTRPFEFIVLSGKEVLYAKKDCTDQLRNNRNISVNSLTHEHKEALGIYVVTAVGVLPSGRTDTGTGAVNVSKLTGDALCNAIMKAETKAKRRMTLSICGLGLLDESELDTVRGAKPIAGAVTNRIVTGVIDQIKVTDHGITGIKIGEEKLWVSDPAIDSQLAAAEGEEVSVEAAERPGTTGKPYWEIVRVLRIRNYDFTNSQDLTPQLQASLDQAQAPAQEVQGIKIPF